MESTICQEIYYTDSQPYKTPEQPLQTWQMLFRWPDGASYKSKSDMDNDILQTKQGALDLNNKLPWWTDNKITTINKYNYKCHNCRGCFDPNGTNHYRAMKSEDVLCLPQYY